MGVSVGQGSRGAISEVNVVPLIDVLLVLLVIFMVITPRKSSGLPVEIPGEVIQVPRKPIVPDPAVVVVEVLGDGSVRINQQLVLWDRLGERLSLIFADRASRVAFVRGEPSVQFWLVARAMDAMRGAGITSIGLLARELEHRRGMV